MSGIKSKSIACILLLIWTVHVSSSVGAETNHHVSEKQTINVGLIIFPPFIQQEENDKCYGIAVDDLTLIFPADKYNVNIHCASPSRIYRNFNSGLIDITINAKSTTSLQSDVIYSEQPYKILEMALYFRDVVKPFKISAIKSYDYHGMREQLESQGNVFTEFSNTKEAIAVFLRGGCDAILSYQLPFEHYLTESSKNRGFGSLNITFKKESLISVRTYFALNRKNKRANELVKTIDDYFISLSK